jgi:hypothetical protein
MDVRFKKGRKLFFVFIWRKLLARASPQSANPRVRNLLTPTPAAQLSTLFAWNSLNVWRVKVLGGHPDPPNQEPRERPDRGS